MRRLPAALSALALAAVASPALAAPTPTFAEQRVFFHCAATKVGNAGAVNGLPSWNTTAPTVSVQAGGGCGSTNVPGFSGTEHQGLYDAVWAGTHTGNIKDITVELHSIYASGARADGLAPFGTTIELLVDGVKYTTPRVDAKPVPSSTRASEKVTFTLTGFGLVDAQDGPGTTERSISVKVRNAYTDQAGAFVYDTVEVPAGLTFNPAKAEAVKAAVTQG